MKRIYSFALVALGLFFMTSSSASAQEAMTARGVIEANIEATGGLAAWRDVKDMVSEADIAFEIPQMGTLELKLESWSIFPGYGYTNIELMGGPAVVTAEQVNQKAYYTPLQGWMEMGGQRSNLSDLPEAQRQQFQRSSPKGELEFLNLPDSALVLLEDEVLNDRPVYAVNVTTNGTTIKFLFDKETKFVAAQETNSPVGKIMSVMSDHRDIGNGFIMAFTQTAEMGGQGTQTISFTNIKVNTGLTPDQIAAKAGVKKKTAAPE